MSGTSILVTEDSPGVERSKRLAESGGFLSRLGLDRERNLRGTFYYPYYFQSWRVTVPKSLGRTLRARLLTGVNALTLSVGPASEFPDFAGGEVPAGTVLEPRAPAEEATRLGLEYVKSLAGGRYRPARPPTIEQETCELLYVPYYVYLQQGASPPRAVLVEGLTGSRGRVRDVPAIYEALGEVVGGCGTPVGIRKGG